MLKRKMEQELLAWKTNNDRRSSEELRKAFILDGARQTGKTYIVRHFATAQYHDTVEVNFFRNEEAASLLMQCASTDEIISALSLLVGHQVEPGKTLVFFDEVQEAPQLITQAKFLVEDGRFNVVMSGSLMGVELKNIKSFPVGYVQTATMYPLDFEEFCWSQGVNNTIIQKMREAFSAECPLDGALHQRLIKLYRLYLVTGGMPEAIQKYIDTRYDLGAVRDMQASIVEQYRFDISKYAKGRELQVRAIFDSLPSELAKENKRFQMKAIKNKATYERYANDFAWLVSAGVALKCNSVTEPHYPLMRTEEQRKFKLYSSDTGLLLAQYPAGVAARALAGARDINFGAIYENAVAQELVANSGYLRYFQNNRKGEVDFLIEDNEGTVIPIEIKSGKDYKLHTALNNLLRTSEYKIPRAYVLSENNVAHGERMGKPVIYLPLYLAFCLAETAVKRGKDAQAGAMLSEIDAAPPSF